MYKITLSRISRMLWCYGSFASVCHAVAILFSATLLENASGGVYFNRYFPMLEHSMISFIIVFIGVAALEYIERKKIKKD